jgi:hypothetical protein
MPLAKRAFIAPARRKAAAAAVRQCNRFECRLFLTQLNEEQPYGLLAECTFDCEVIREITAVAVLKMQEMSIDGHHDNFDGHSPP